MIDPVNIFCAWGCVKWAKNNSRPWSTSVPHPPAWLESYVLVFVFYNQSPEKNISKCFIVGETWPTWCVMHFLWITVIWILVKCEKVWEGWILVSVFSCRFWQGGLIINHKMEFVLLQAVLLKIYKSLFKRSDLNQNIYEYSFTDRDFINLLNQWFCLAAHVIRLRWERLGSSSTSNTEKSLHSILVLLPEPTFLFCHWSDLEDNLFHLQLNTPWIICPWPQDSCNTVYPNFLMLSRLQMADFN